MRALPALLAAACLTSVWLTGACSRQSPEAPSTPATGVAKVAAGAPAAKAAPVIPASPGVPRDVKQANGLIDFEYSYPAAADAIPALKAFLDADLADQKAGLIDSARDRQAESKKNDFPFHPLGNWVDWKVVTDLPGWLSLSADVTTDEGGAHPNHGFDALLWDKHANARRAPLDLFTSKQALSRVIRRDFCAALNRQRAQKRGAPVDPKSTDEFDQCIDPVDNTVILGSSDHRSFDRIGVLVAPYGAGPYVEGDYQVTLPVTDALLAVVKPQYRSSFAIRR